MDTIAIRQQLHDIINTANDQQVENIYAMIKGNGADDRCEWWKDEEFVAELEQISADMKSGKDKGITWEELKEQLKSRQKKDGV